MKTIYLFVLAVSILAVGTIFYSLNQSDVAKGLSLGNGSYQIENKVSPQNNPGKFEKKLLKKMNNVRLIHALMLNGFKVNVVLAAIGYILMLDFLLNRGNKNIIKNKFMFSNLFGGKAGGRHSIDKTNAVDGISGKHLQVSLSSLRKQLLLLEMKELKEEIEDCCYFNNRINNKKVMNLLNKSIDSDADSASFAFDLIYGQMARKATLTNEDVMLFLKAKQILSKDPDLYHTKYHRITV